jgi:putative membrane protein
MKLAKILLLMLGSACTFLAVAQPPQPMQPSRLKEMMISGDEKTFFEKAAVAGQYEVQSGQLAATKAADPELKQFGKQMVDDHTKADEQLTALAQQKNVTLPTALDSKHQKMLDSLNSAQAGKDFDELYRKEMVASHKEAVSLFDKAARSAKDPDVKQFAAQMLPTLQQHGGRAKELNKS